MKNRSLILVLKIRYWSSIVYFISMLYYGIRIIELYGVQDIGIASGWGIILSFLVALMCIMVKGESLLKNSDPLNVKNQKKYVTIMVLEVSEIIVAYILATVADGAKQYIYIYCTYVIIIFLICGYIHRGIIQNYEIIKANGNLSEILDEYQDRIKEDMDIAADTDYIFKNFIRFVGYIIGLVFVYKYTLNSWIGTTVFIALNILVLWKLHWQGIKKLIKHSKVYFSFVSSVATFGIILMKLIYDKNIYISFFEGRDEQEYLMVLILFFLPIVFYGKKVSVRYINNGNKWVE